MTEATKPEADETHVARMFQDLHAPEREVFGLRIMTIEDKTIIVEFPGAGARLLLEKLQAAFEKNPEMAQWGKNIQTH